MKKVLKPFNLAKQNPLLALSASQIPFSEGRMAVKGTGLAEVEVLDWDTKDNNESLNHLIEQMKDSDDDSYDKSTTSSDPDYKEVMLCCKYTAQSTCKTQACSFVQLVIRCISCKCWSACCNCNNHTPFPPPKN